MKTKIKSFFRQVFTGAKKARLIVSILLSVISLSVFACSLSAWNPDGVTAELKAAYAAGEKTVDLLAIQKTMHVACFENGKWSFWNRTFSAGFTNQQIDKLSLEGKIYPARKSDLSFGDTTGYTEKSNLFGRFIGVAPDTAEEEFCLTPVAQSSRLPIAKEEVAITDYHADLFMRYGYSDVQGDNKKQEISSPDELLGKRIAGMTIVGVYATQPSYGELKKKGDAFLESYLKGESMINTGFISQEYFENFYLNRIVYRLSGSIAKDKKRIRDISFVEYRDFTGAHDKFSYSRNYYTVEVKSSYSEFAAPAWMFFHKTFLTVTLTASVTLSALSTVLLAGVLSASNETRKRKERESKKRLIWLCFAESATVAGFEFLLSSAFGGLICLILNRYYHIFWFGLNAISVLCLALFCFGLAAVAAIPTVKRIKKTERREELARS